MFCKKCGKKLENDALVCPGCGCMSENGERLAREANTENTSTYRSTSGYLFTALLAPVLSAVGAYVLWQINWVIGLILIGISATGGINILIEWKREGGEMSVFFKDFIRSFCKSSAGATLLTVTSVLCLIHMIVSVAFVIYLQ